LNPIKSKRKYPYNSGKDKHMSCEIYYFSGTGHSLLAARDMADCLGATCIPMVSRIQETKIQCDADTICLVFPIYHATFGASGLPVIVSDFVNKLINLQGKYIFAIGTHSGFPGLTMEKLAQRLGNLGGKLSAGIMVQLNVPYKTPEKMRHAFFKKPLDCDWDEDRKERETRMNSWHKSMANYAAAIKERESIPLDFPGPVKRIWWKGYLAFQKKMALAHYQELTGSDSVDFMALTLQADCTFSTTEACKGCGTCVKICPTQNISMIDGKPVWQHRCENCAACYHWCPSHAIEGDMMEYEKPVEAPGITIKDMLAQTASFRSKQ
jgi:ferredoxin